MSLALTPKQERVWRYLRGRERSPTYREMERDLGYHIGRLNDVIVTLKDKGYVSYVPRRARSLVALDPSSDLSAVSTEALVAELARRSAQ